MLLCVIYVWVPQRILHLDTCIGCKQSSGRIHVHGFTVHFAYILVFSAQSFLIAFHVVLQCCCIYTFKNVFVCFSEVLMVISVV